MKNFILPIIFIVAAVGVFVGYISPAYDEVKALRQEASAYDEALSKSRELQAVRDTLLSRYNTFAPEDVNRIVKFLPDHVDNVRLILDIDGIASEYNLVTRNVIVSEQPGTETGAVGPNTQPYQSVVVSFSVTATYEDFLRFMQDLEQSLRLVDVTALSFSVNQGDLYEFDVSIRTYWLK